MWKIIVCAIFALAGTVTLPVTTHAQPSAADTKLAEDLAQQAFNAYAKGEFLPAITLYKKAYQTSFVGVILFNIANIYDKKIGDKKQASDYYQRYLRSNDSEPGLVKRASERIDIIRAEIEASKLGQVEDRPPPKSAALSRPALTTTTSTTATSLSSPPPVSEPGTKLRIVGLSTAAVGLGGLVLGGVYGFIAKSKNDQASEVCNGSVCPDQRGLTLTNDANRAALVSTVSFIAGGVFVVGGVGLFIYGSKKGAGRAERFSIRMTPQLGGVTFSGAW